MGLARRFPLVLPALILLLLTALVVTPGARAGDARGVTATRDQLRAAHRAHMAAERREAEAAFVYRATCNATAAYGSPVGRWVWLSRQVGWPRSQVPALMYVINRESRGDPGVVNPSSGCAGLLQLHPLHGLGETALDPRTNLSFGLRLWRSNGWTPWGG